MNRIAALLICLFCLGACREKAPDAGVELSESTAVLQIHRTGTELEEVDFERELQLCESNGVLSAAAKSLGLTVADISHLELKVLSEANQIEVTVKHPDAETARALASAIASSYMTARGEREKQKAAERLSKLDAELEAEEIELREQMAAFEVLLNGAGKEFESPPSFEQDRMTYQKAKAALLEAQIEEQEALVKQLRDHSAEMDVSLSSITEEEYAAAKLAYVEALEALKKLKAE